VTEDQPRRPISDYGVRKPQLKLFAQRSISGAAFQQHFYIPDIFWWELGGRL